MKILITGYNGFIGKNLLSILSQNSDLEILTFGSRNSLSELKNKIKVADFIFHLAGVNRPVNDSDFNEVNLGLTKIICKYSIETGRKIPIVFTSSIHVKYNNLYGKSKYNAEKILKRYNLLTDSAVYIFRLPHVIGKWCKPNYNSVVATFCYNIANGKDINIENPDFKLSLVYIDDLVNKFSELIFSKGKSLKYCSVSKIYKLTVGKLAKLLFSFKHSRDNLLIENVGTGLTRILYSTFISYFPPEKFVYDLRKNDDNRGSFVEVIKTKSAGQFSYFTANPGVTRGCHYHHSKTEKFILLSGKAKFRFENLITGDYYEIIVDSKQSKVVETIPGWIHDITNIGEVTLLVLLWANEIFNPDRPDTIMKNIITYD